MVKEKVMKLLRESKNKSKIMVTGGVIALLTSVCAGLMQGLISSNDDIIVEKSSKKAKKILLIMKLLVFQ